jgi:uncharacterized protein (DUF433 family)
MTTSFEGFDRITVNPEVLGGKPCIRGMRLSVQRVLEILADNPDRDELRQDYPELEDEDIRQALAFAAAILTDQVIVRHSYSPRGRKPRGCRRARQTLGDEATTRASGRMSGICD